MRVKYPKRGGEIIPPVLTKIPQIMETLNRNVKNEILEISFNTTGTQKVNKSIKAYLIASFVIGGIFALAFTLNHLGLLKEA